MATEERTQRAVEFVKLGYADIFDNAPFRSLHFRTDGLTTTEAQAVIRVVTQYNSFEGERVAGALERFRRRVSHYEFGRAGSPVLHISLPYTSNQVEEQRSHVIGSRISDADHQTLLKEMRKVFVDELGAEAFETTDTGKHEIQVWWG